MRELAREGLRDDQGRVVFGYRHPVREGDSVSDLAHGAVGVDRCDEAGRDALVGVEVAAAVDPDGAAAIDHDLVQTAGQASQIGMVDQRSVRVAP